MVCICRRWLSEWAGHHSRVRFMGWYFVVDAAGGRVGPLSDDEVERLVADSLIAPDQRLFDDSGASVAAQFVRARSASGTGTQPIPPPPLPAGPARKKKSPFYLQLPSRRTFAIGFAWWLAFAALRLALLMSKSQSRPATSKSRSHSLPRPTTTYQPK